MSSQIVFILLLPFYLAISPAVYDGENLIPDKILYSVREFVSVNCLNPSRVRDYEIIENGKVRKIYRYIHVVKKGQSLDFITKNFKVNKEQVLLWNPLLKLPLTTGQKVSILLEKPDKEFAFSWPTVNRSIISHFGYKEHPIFKSKIFHIGIDIESNFEVVRASRAGQVEYTQFIKGYGNTIIISHEMGYKTRYAHLAEFRVKKGDHVRGGQIIGVSGNTGVTTGPHLHFEIRRDGGLVNPLLMLPEE